MKTTLVRNATQDKLILHGALREPERKTKKLVLHIHGMAGNFYQNKFLEDLAEKLTSSDWAFLSVNTRGHGHISEEKYDTKKERYTLIGNYNEKFEDCVLDIKSWIDFAETQGFEKLVLQGHSLGCSKVVYYLSKTHDNRVDKLILLAPSDMIGITEKWKGHKEVLKEAKSMIKEGKGKELLSKRLDEWYHLTAKTYVNFGERGNSIDVFNIYDPKKPSISLARIKLPILALVGSKDWCMVINPIKAMHILRDKAKSCTQFDIAVIEGANHGYDGKEDDMAQILIEWLNKK